MSLGSVKMAEEVWLTCLTHALTTETEEIMGLLLGDIQYSDGGHATALIWGASPQMRSDRRKDRVETNPELLAAASAQAEISIISQNDFGNRKNNKGHWLVPFSSSHYSPSISCSLPSADVRTQAMYQLLDNGFLGLIFSCYSEDSLKVGRIQVIAFQSMDGKQRQVPLNTNSSIIEVETSWTSSENSMSPFNSSLIKNTEQDTGDSRASKSTRVGGRSPELGELFSHADVDYSAKQRARESSLTVYNEGNVTNAGASLDSSDMTPSMQEALHRSNMDMSGAEYVRKEVPLQVLPARYLWSLDSPLSSFTDMQHVLFEEERSAYKQAILQNMRLNPAISILQDRLKENEIKLATLMEEAKSLESVAQSVKSGIKSENPHHRGNRSSAAVPTTKESQDSAGPRSPSSIGSRRKVP
ncbi:hypothetical protein ZIOFF_037365 [Zingiber officinale]|uniref:JAB1/MPN/MOV34 metalloenzyme domain-containing protein n=1 Tax=Zingiber officinale TaxID=94328 RepID=A0A8J5L420_ZINOF|nr:hypothetical protein ZIOFF_037365 [Zingiber officinale]